MAMTSKLKPYQKLQRYWRDTEARVSTVRLSAQAIDDLERKYGIDLPDDFADYLLHSCPEDDFAVDNNMTSWWPLDRIKSIPEEYQHESSDVTIARDAAKFLFFADYAIWCWAWAIACGGDNRGRVAVISGRDRFVADSFAQFVDVYIDDCRQLL